MMNESRRQKNKEQTIKNAKVEEGGKINMAQIKKIVKKGSSNQSILREYEHFSEKAIELIMFNKINAKNAFDVNVEFLESLPNLLNKNEESSWQKASASLDASAKIYGFRVDSVHSETFKFLGGLTRADKVNENEEGEGGNDDKKEKKDKIGRHEGYTTLEKDVKKLNLVKFDLEFEVDPLFKSMTAKFNEAGARGLLLNNLPIDENLDVWLESKERKESEVGKMGACSKLSDDLANENKEIIEETLSKFTITDLKSIQICPDLSYFKKTRELETSLERTFYQNLMQEIDDNTLRENILNDKSGISDSLNESIMLPDNLNDNISSLSQAKSDIESGASQQFDENMDMNINLINISNDIQKNITGISYNDGFLMKHDELLDYQNQFGDGSKDILRTIQFQTFSKGFNLLERANLNFGMKTLGNIENKRVKKEEKLFDFSVENEIAKGEIFMKDSKVKYNSKDLIKKERKKKVREFYNYDKSSIFKLFSIWDRRFTLNPSEESKQNPYNKEEAFMNNNQDIDDGINNEEDNNNNNNNNVPDNEAQQDQTKDINTNNNQMIEAFQKFDVEYEKKFGNLYKTFDVRYLKSKLWDSFSLIQTTQKKSADGEVVAFKSIMGNMTQTMSKAMLDNISTPTCFVCFLHLCNEKTLQLEEVDENNFIVKSI